LPFPRESISLRDKQEITGLLLKCGATIDEINVIRKHLSGIKGGRLAQAAFPSRLFCLILSDVVGDSLSTIASGPTVGDPSTFSDCENVLEKYEIRHEASETVQEIITGGLRGNFDETPKPGDEIFHRVSNVIIGSNRNALEAAATEASSLGFNLMTLSTRMTGEAREVGTMLANKMAEICDTDSPVAPPACLLAGGETTVTIRGAGKGGRNQELALAAAIELAEHRRRHGADMPDVVIAGVGTDGGDGPTDAAGAIVDTTTVERAERKGLDPMASLNENDSYHLLGPIGDLLITGPTGTNVMDLMIALVA
jgi:hydroxypyruvate reductase